MADVDDLFAETEQAIAFVNGVGLTASEARARWERAKAEHFVGAASPWPRRLPPWVGRNATGEPLGVDSDGGQGKRRGKR